MNFFRDKTCKTDSERVLCSTASEERRNSESKQKSRFSTAISKVLSFALAASMVLQNGGSVPVYAEETEPGAAGRAVNIVSTADSGIPLSTSGSEVGKVLTSKDVSANGDQFNVSLSALSSTSDETTTTTTPLDIVLVLDRSGSMADRFSETGSGRTTKMASLKSAVGSFLNEVETRNKNISDQDKKIQVGMVSYGSEAGTSYQLTSNLNQIRNGVDNLSANGATRADLGMKAGGSILSKGRENANQVAIFFTDGLPTSHREFDNDVATGAISAALGMKNSGAQVYSIGIFDGANSTVNPNSVGTGSRESETSRANRFMQMVSSNCPTASSFTQTPVDYSQKAFYLTAKTASGLTTVFNQIFSDITSQPVHPVAADSASAVAFSDELGKGMEVASITSLTYGETTFTNPQKNADGSYTFSGTVKGNILADGDQNLSSITVRVIKGEGMNGDTVIFEVPSALLPLVKYHKDSQGKQTVEKGALPISLNYTVQPKQAIRDQLSGNADNFSAEAAEFIRANEKDGRLVLYSNAYQGGENGTTTAVFTPNADNAYYYAGGSQAALETVSKSENKTQTAANRESSVWNGQSVTTYLGNNGRLEYQDVLGNLTVSKTVQVPDGYTVDESKEFAFDVTLQYPDQNKTPISGTFTARVDGTDSELAFDQNGKAQIQLRHGQIMIIKDLPRLASYTVTEKAEPGYTAYVNGSSQPSQTASGSVTDDSSADFLNLYSAQKITLDPVQSNLRGSKTLEGRDWFDSDEFEFVLSAETPNAPLPANAENGIVRASVKKDNPDFSFGNITFEKPGEYIYLINEVTSEIPGISTDGTNYRVIITVTDNGDGTLKASSEVMVRNTVTGEEVQIDSVQFTNKFDAAEAAFTPRFVKALVSDQTEPDLNSAEFNQQFEFELKPADGTAMPMPEGTVDGKAAASNRGNNVSFGKITYTSQEVGHTYRYSVKEVKGSLPGITYSDTEYELVVQVGSKADEQGEQAVELTVETYLDGKKLDDYLTDAVFTNRLTLNPVTLNTDTGIHVDKTLTGKAIEDGEFSFRIDPVDETKLAVENGDVVIPNDVVTVKAAVLENGSANSSTVFENITFNKTGTYRFMISEVIPENGKGSAGITYDETKHFINVVVSRAADSTQMEAVVQYEPGASGSISFENSYSAKPTDPVSVNAVKNVNTADGFKQPDAYYSFTLTPENGSPVTFSAKADQPFEVLNNRIYSEPGVYTYILKENPEASLGNGNYLANGSVDFDQTEYRITVTVTDNLQGQLLASTQIAKRASADAEFEDLGTDESIVFTNSYHPQPVTTNNQTQPAAYKQLIGREQTLQEGEFTFNASLDGNPQDGAVYNGEATTTNAENGSIQLGSITFSKPGTYTLTVTEVKDDTKPYIEYDSTPKTWTYEVTDVNGALQIEYSQPDSLLFNNSYSATGSFAMSAVPVEKTFTGRLENEWLDTDVFEFELSAGDEETAQAVENKEVILPTETLIKATAENKAPAFGDIQFNKAGSYVFTVKEKAGNLEGVSYDTTEYQVKIDVTDNNDGTLSAALAKEVKLVFTNIYTAEQATLDTSKDLTISKDLTGKPWSAESFDFELSLTEGNADHVSINSPKLTLNAENRSGSFGNILFTAPGVYRFEISETGGTQPSGGSMSFDDHKIAAEVTVTDNGQGQLIAEVTSVSGALNFVNVFKANETTVQFAGSKVLTGREWLDDDEFIFELKDEDGKVIQTKVAKRDNQQIVFDPISYSETGTWTYTISEQPGAAENGLTYDDSVKTITVKVTQNEETGALQAETEGDSAFTFTNTYDAAPVTGLADFKAAKEVVSENTPFAMAAGQFEFTVTADSNNGETDPYAGSRKVSNAADGSVSLFENAEFTVPGTYRYTVSESDNQIPGMSYDSAVYTLTVTVSDNQSGNLEKTVLIQKDGADTDAIRFTNKYNPDAASAMIQVQKELSGKELADGMFRFTLNYLGMDAVKDEVQDAESDQNNSTEAGNGNTETPADTPAASQPAADQGADSNGENADSQTPAEQPSPKPEENEASGQPAESSAPEQNQENGQAEGEPAPMNDDGDQTPKPEETKAPEEVPAANPAPAGQEVKPEENQQPAAENKPAEVVTANETGPADQTDDQDKDASEDAAESQIPAVLEQTNIGSMVSFDSIQFSKPGDYHFVIREVNDGQPGVTYDQSELSVTVRIRHDQANGKLIVEAIDGAGSELQTFRNTYVPNPVTVASAQIHASKKLEGRDLKDGEFRFELIDNEGNVAATGVNDANGIITFEPVGDALTFTKTGTYAYVLKEVSDENVGGVTFDETTYGVLITVTDENAQLVADVQIQNEANAAEFKNIYKAASTSFAPSVIKRFEGAELKDNQFEFTLSEDGTVLQKVSNKADGSVNFEALNFEEAGTHTYQIVEVKGSKANVEYDEKVLTLTVTVTDNGNGQLEAAGSYDSEAVFTNKAVEVRPNPPKGDGCKKTPIDKVKDAPTAVQTGLAAGISTIILSLTGIVLILFRRRQMD